MRRKIFFIVTAVLSVLLIKTGFPQNTIKDSLNLEQALKLALKNQPLIMQAESEVRAAEAKISEQKSFDYPDVEGELSYSRVGPVPSIVFGSEIFNLFPANNYDAHVSARYQVYDFGKKDALLNLTKSYKVPAEEKINYIKNQLTYKTAQTFYTILFLQQSLDVKNDEIKTLKEHIGTADKRVENGTATDFDVLTTKVRVAAAENQKMDIKNAINKAKILMRALLGLPSDTPVNVSGSLKLPNSIVSKDSLINAALTQREEIKIATDSENSIKLQKEAAALGDKPSLNAFGSFGIKNGYMPNLKVLRGNWVVGLAANVPIFNGYRTDAKVQEAQANLDANDAHLLELERKIKAEVESSLSELNNSRNKLGTTELQVKQAEQALQRAKTQYQNGVITNLDLLDAETSLSEAQLLHLRVVYRNVINTYNVKEAAGDEIR